LAGWNRDGKREAGLAQAASSGISPCTHYDQPGIGSRWQPASRIHECVSSMFSST